MKRSARGALSLLATMASTLATFACSTPAIRDAERTTSSRQPVIGAEFPLELTGTYKSPYGTRGQPSVAFDGTNHLVVWADNRLLSRNIMGTRLTPGGEVLDSAGITISPAPSQQSSPKVSFGAGAYLVVWQEAGIRARLIDPNGVPLGPTFEPVPGVPSAGGFDLVFDGSNFVLAWYQGDANNKDVYAARIQVDGTCLDPGGVAVSDEPYFEWYPNISFDGQNYLVTWCDERSGSSDIYGKRFSTSMVALDPVPIAITAGPTSQQIHDVAFDGTNYLVVWGDVPLSGARVSPNGEVLDTSPIPLFDGTKGGGHPAISCMPSSCIVTWLQSSNDPYDYYDYLYYAARVQDGLLLDPSGIELSKNGEHWYTAVDHDNEGWVTVRVEGDVLASRVDLDGNTLDETAIQLSWAESSLERASVVRGQDQFLALFNERDGDDKSKTRAVRVTEQGEVLDHPSLLLGSSGYRFDTPRAASDGSGYLTVWTEKRNSQWYVVAARVTSAGQVLDPGGFDLVAPPGRKSSPSLAFDGQNYLLVWRDNRSGSWDLYATRVSPTGEALDGSGFPIAATTGDELHASLTFGGGLYLAVWEEGDNVLAARVQPNGLVLDPGGIAVNSFSTVGMEVAAEFGDGVFGVVWVDNRDGTNDIYGARITLDGVVMDPDGVLVGDADSYLSHPRIVFDGRAFFVAWQTTNYGVWSDVRGSWFGLDGLASDPQGVLVSGEPGDEQYPTLASGTAGRVLVAYSRYTYNIASQSDRVFGRMLGTFALGSPCQVDSSCFTGYCVDGVCCTDSCGDGSSDDCVACSAMAGASEDGTCGPIANGAPCSGGQCQSGTCVANVPVDSGIVDVTLADVVGDSSSDATGDVGASGHEDAPADALSDLPGSDATSDMFSEDAPVDWAESAGGGCSCSQGRRIPGTSELASLLLLTACYLLRSRRKGDRRTA